MAGSKRRLFTPEQEAWVAEHYANETNADIVRQLADEFGVSLAITQLSAWAKRNGCRKSEETIRYTRARGADKARLFSDEMCDFLREYIPGRLRDEVNDEFERRFGWRLSKTQYKSIKTRLGVRAGVFGGRFEKGHVPANKGKKWDEYMPKESQEKVRAAGNLFKKGQRSQNAYHELLDTRIDQNDGSVYIYVKPRHAKYSAQHWISYAQFVWMQHNGREFPEDCRCVHANHDKNDYRPENLMVVPNEVYGLITGNVNGAALEYWDRESLKLAILHAKLIMTRVEKERTRPRRCTVCGTVFVPTGKRAKWGERVHTCEACAKQGKRAPSKRRRTAIEHQNP